MCMVSVVNVFAYGNSLNVHADSDSWVESHINLYSTGSWTFSSESYAYAGGVGESATASSSAGSWVSTSAQAYDTDTPMDRTDSKTYSASVVGSFTLYLNVYASATYSQAYASISATYAP
jgi:hypothetical protein